MSQNKKIEASLSYKLEKTYYISAGTNGVG
jgi:hypothetical protein